MTMTNIYRDAAYWVTVKRDLDGYEIVGDQISPRVFFQGDDHDFPDKREAIVAEADVAQLCYRFAKIGEPNISGEARLEELRKFVHANGLPAEHTSIPWLLMHAAFVNRILWLASIKNETREEFCSWLKAELASLLSAQGEDLLHALENRYPTLPTKPESTQPDPTLYDSYDFQKEAAHAMGKWESFDKLDYELVSQFIESDGEAPEERAERERRLNGKFNKKLVDAARKQPKIRARRLARALVSLNLGSTRRCYTDGYERPTFALGSPLQLIYWQAADAIEEGNLGWCDRCRSAFTVTHGSQKYCGEQCANAARSKKYRQKKKEAKNAQA